MDARESLIKELIRTGYLKNPRIIEAFRAIDRADFVLPEYRGEAYGNYPLPIGEGQTISQPLTVAFMLELLDAHPGEKILDVGSGSGWTTALLAYIVSGISFLDILKEENRSQKKIGADIISSQGKRKSGKVFGLERIPQLCRFGQKNLAKYFDESVAQIICADGTFGFPEEAPYDKILAGAAASRDIPQAWRDQLKVGGRIVAPVGGSVRRFIKTVERKKGKVEEEWQEEEFPGFAFVPLVKGNDKDADGQSYAERLQKFKRSRLFRTIGYWLLAIGLGGGIFVNEIYLPHTAFSGSKSVEIHQGFGSRKIAELLKKKGIIRSKWAFIIYATLSGSSSKLKPGSYIFSHKDSIPIIVEALVQGGYNERLITIPEGWTSREIAEYLDKEGIVSWQDFLRVVQHRELNNFVQLPVLNTKDAEGGLEGYLFPDTYRIFANSKPKDIVVKMLENFNRKVTPELRKEIERQGKTLHEIIIMASLIEKEIPHEEDRPIVAGILWKRLKIGMALQVDATITYIKKTQNPKLKTQNSHVSLEDIKIDSPYNTYKYPGLPPGPIANPGLSAIKAAIYPKESPYLFYLSKPNGETVFSKTLEEHNAAKAKYLD